MELSDLVDPWEDVAFELIGESKIMPTSTNTNTEANISSECKKIQASNNKITVIDYKKDDIKIENSKFCTWSIGQCDSLLTPANLSLGLCGYNDKYYGFSTIDAAMKFQENPDKYNFS